ncbi:MAG TPA: CsgG/HfaB family protein [bacterium]|nr:CsgG/HfaB family protein [bacterium]
MRRMWWSLVVCALGVLAAFSGPGAAQDARKVVAVVPFADMVHGWSGTGAVVTDHVVGKLRDVQALRVLPVPQVQDALTQAHAGSQGVLDTAEAQKVGQALGAAYVVMGEVDQFDWQSHSAYVLVATVVQQTASVALKGQVFDVARGQVVGTPEGKAQITQTGGSTWVGPWWSSVSVDNFDSQLIGKAASQAVDKLVKQAGDLMK